MLPRFLEHTSILLGPEAHPVPVLAHLFLYDTWTERWVPRARPASPTSVICRVGG